MKLTDTLIVDTAGFIKNAALRDFAEKEIITLNEVISEIRDKATRERIQSLQLLPFDVQFREPSTEAIRKVTEFSKKTGDFPSLSTTDIKVLALTYMVEVEKAGNDNHLKTEPSLKKTEVHFDKKIKDSEANQVGFYKPNTENDSNNNEETIANENENDPEELLTYALNKIEIREENETEEFSNNSDNSEEEDDDEGWITPSNIKQNKRQEKQVNGDEENDVEPEQVKVACLTTDFAMQNVLKQMGLNVVSLDGMLIKETRTWILRCYACFQLTSLMHKKFCPKCGNKTLKRVSVTLNKDGSKQIHISTKRLGPISARGKKFSLPKFQTGKHAVNPILTEDQRLPQQRQTKLARQKTDAMNADYVDANSPFSMNDVTSKSAMLGVPGKGQMNSLYWMQKNPNAVKTKTGNKRKKNKNL